MSQQVQYAHKAEQWYKSRTRAYDPGSRFCGDNRLSSRQYGNLWSCQRWTLIVRG